MLEYSVKGYLGIEGIPFIIRFKTWILIMHYELIHRIEGIPFIIRFKTHNFLLSNKTLFVYWRYSIYNKV